MITNVSRERLPRYKRANKPPPMQITDRDVAILDAVCEMRFLTSDQIQSLLFGPSTASSCRRRLSLLYHNTYLDRILVPMKNAFGSTRAVYILAQKGAGFVARARGCEVRELDWKPGDLDRELFFIRHTLEINDFRIMVSRAARQTKMTLEWTDERTLRRREMKDHVDDPKNHGRKLAVVPDGQFKLGINGQTHAFVLELDRATVEERPFKAKVRALGEWKVTGAYERRFGSKSLRVLFVVSNLQRDRERLDRIKRWAEAEGARSLFWFVQLEDLTPDALFTATLWQVASRDGRFSLFGASTWALPT